MASSSSATGSNTYDMYLSPCIWMGTNVSNNTFSAAPSNNNNMQDQCLIITDIYGVREKGCVAGNTISNPNTMKSLKKRSTTVPVA